MIPALEKQKLQKLKKNTSLSGYFSLDVKLCTQVIFPVELNGEGCVYMSLDQWSLHNICSCIIWIIFQTP